MNIRVSPDARPVPAEHLGPIGLAPGVRRQHALCYLFAALISIGLFTYFSALTPQILRVNLGIAAAEHGRISGDLQTLQEIVLLLTIGLWGALSDRVGRRIVYVASFTILALGYGLYAFAGSTTELFAWRMLLGFGLAGCAAMLVTLLADYPDETSRGRFTGLAFFLNGVGSVVFFLGLTKLPLVFEARGAGELWAGRYALLVVAALALVAAVVMLGLKTGPPAAVTERVPLTRLIREGIAAAARPRIALCYAGAFTARADMAIITIFVTLWVAQSAAGTGLTAAESTARAGMVVGIAQAAALFWSPVFGWLSDRLDRVTVMAVGFLLGVIGYGWVGTLADPGSVAAVPALVMLGVGQASTALASTVLLGQEAPAHIRGSVFGLQSFCGALGILAISAGGGRLFDAVGPWSPFMVMAVANGVVAGWALALRAAENRQILNPP
jgi:MFS family permease